jgi:hypothetical protein
MSSLDRAALLAVLLIGVCACSPASAATTASHRGTFVFDDEIQLIGFSVPTRSEVVIRTLSYGGGTQADGTVIAPGGFDPVLELFDGGGRFMVEADDEDPPGTANADPNTGEAFDASMDLTLDAGFYALALVQYDNAPNGGTLSDGFERTGSPRFTGRFGCSNGQFCDFPGNNRSGAWAVDILVTDIPEPSVCTLVVAGLAVFSLRSRRLR